MTVQSLRKNEAALSTYATNEAHLEDELKKLDLIIALRKHVLQGRARQMETSKGAPLSPPLYISNEEIDHLLQAKGAAVPDDPGTARMRKAIESLQQQIQDRVKRSIAAGTFLALPRLAHIFGLSPFELQVVVICLAPELHRKYDTLYAYLQDDITRKKPSVDLVLDLLCSSVPARWRARAVFTQQAPLFRAGLLCEVDDPQSPSGASDLARFLKLDPRILNDLLGNHGLDDRLAGMARLYPAHPETPAPEDLAIDAGICAHLSGVLKTHFASDAAARKKLTFHFYGPPGVGKKTLAAALCKQISCPLLVIDVPQFPANADEWDALLHLAFREGLLQQAALYFDRIDPWVKDAGSGPARLKKLAEAIQKYGWLTFFSSDLPCAGTNVFRETAFHGVALALPDAALRTQAWEAALGAVNCEAEKRWAGALAGRFRLTPGQIQDAVRFALNQASDSAGRPEITRAALYAACRKQSNPQLQALSLKISPRCGWQDIVLPEGPLAQLKELCQQVKHRAQVFSAWGFSGKLSRGKGLSVLFSGPPGTGKTMAAEVIAKALQLDLYKIDLSSIVSKYIGETEKNLSKIFHEAETSNAILFFDEADALFGKRTEVSDAHDRYANIETGYLLQKMEEYEGVVILATNLRDNMDEAFTRRIRFIVEFPFPDLESRLKIWKGHFPEAAPLDDDIDFDFLAKRVQVAGGNIKNIILNAAFCAAEEGTAIGMRHLMHGTKREYEKIGKMWNESTYQKKSA